MSEDRSQEPIRIEFARPREREQIDPADVPVGRERFTPGGFLTMGRVLGRRLGDIFRPPAGRRDRPPPAIPRIPRSRGVPRPEDLPLDVEVQRESQRFEALPGQERQPPRQPPQDRPYRWWERREPPVWYAVGAGGGGTVEEQPQPISRSMRDFLLGRFAETDSFLAPSPFWQGRTGENAVKDALMELAHVDEPWRWVDNVIENASEHVPLPTEAHPLQQRARVTALVPPPTVPAGDIAERTELRGLREAYVRLARAGRGSIYRALNVPAGIRSQLRPDPKTFDDFVAYVRQAANEQRGLLQWSERYGRGRPRGPRGAPPPPVTTWPMLVPEPESTEDWFALTYPIFRGQGPQARPPGARSLEEKIPLAARILDPVQAQQVIQQHLRPFGLDTAKTQDRELLQLLESLSTQDLGAVHRYGSLLDFFYRRSPVGAVNERGTQWLLGSQPGAPAAEVSAYRTRLGAMLRSASRIGVEPPREVVREAARLDVQAGTYDETVLDRLAPGQREALQRMFPDSAPAQSALLGGQYSRLRWGLDQFESFDRFPASMADDVAAYPAMLGLHGGSELALRLGREPHLVKALVDVRIAAQQTAPLRATMRSQELQAPYRQLLSGRGSAPNLTLLDLERGVRQRLGRLASLGQRMGYSLTEMFEQVTPLTADELLERQAQEALVAGGYRELPRQQATAWGRKRDLRTQLRDLRFARARDERIYGGPAPPTSDVVRQIDRIERQLQASLEPELRESPLFDVPPAAGEFGRLEDRLFQLQGYRYRRLHHWMERRRDVRGQVSRLDERIQRINIQLEEVSEATGRSRLARAQRMIEQAEAELEGVTNKGRIRKGKRRVGEAIQRYQKTEREVAGFPDRRRALRADLTGVQGEYNAAREQLGVIETNVSGLERNALRRLEQIEKQIEAPQSQAAALLGELRQMVARSGLGTQATAGLVEKIRSRWVPHYTQLAETPLEQARLDREATLESAARNLEDRAERIYKPAALEYILRSRRQGGGQLPTVQQVVQHVTDHPRLAQSMDVLRGDEQAVLRPFVRDVLFLMSDSRPSPLDPPFEPAGVTPRLATPTRADVGFTGGLFVRTARELASEAASEGRIAGVNPRMVAELQRERLELIRAVNEHYDRLERSQAPSGWQKYLDAAYARRVQTIGGRMRRSVFEAAAELVQAQGVAKLGGRKVDRRLIEEVVAQAKIPILDPQRWTRSALRGLRGQSSQWQTSTGVGEWAAGEPIIMAAKGAPYVTDAPAEVVTGRPRRVGAGGLRQWVAGTERQVSEIVNTFVGLAQLEEINKFEAAIADELLVPLDEGADLAEVFGRQIAGLQSETDFRGATTNLSEAIMGTTNLEHLAEQGEIHIAADVAKAAGIDPLLFQRSPLQAMRQVAKSRRAREALNNLLHELGIPMIEPDGLRPTMGERLQAIFGYYKRPWQQHVRPLRTGPGLRPATDRHRQPRVRTVPGTVGYSAADWRLAPGRALPPPPARQYPLARTASDMWGAWLENMRRLRWNLDHPRPGGVWLPDEDRPPTEEEWWTSPVYRPDETGQMQWVGSPIYNPEQNWVLGGDEQRRFRQVLTDQATQIGDERALRRERRAAMAARRRARYPRRVRAAPVSRPGWVPAVYEGYHRFQPDLPRGRWQGIFEALQIFRPKERLLPREQWEGQRVVQPLLLPEEVAGGGSLVVPVAEEGGAVVRPGLLTRMGLGADRLLDRHATWLEGLPSQVADFMGHGRGRGYTLPGLSPQQEERLIAAVGDMWDPVERKLYINPYEHPVVTRTRFVPRAPTVVEGLRPPAVATSTPTLPYDQVYDIGYPRWPPTGGLKGAWRSWTDLPSPQQAARGDFFRSDLHRRIAVGSYNIRQAGIDLFQRVMPTWALPTSTEFRHRMGNLANWRGSVLGPAFGAAAFGLSGDPFFGVAVGLGARMAGIALENRFRRRAGGQQLPQWYREIESPWARVFSGGGLWQSKFEGRDRTGAGQLGNRQSIYDAQQADYDRLARELLGREYGVESTYDAKRVQEYADHLAEISALGQDDLRWRPQKDSLVGIVSSRSNERLRAEHLFVIYGRASERARTERGLSETRPPGFWDRLVDVPMGEFRYMAGRAARAYSPATLRQKWAAGQWLGPVEIPLFAGISAAERAPGLLTEIATGSTAAAWREDFRVARRAWGYWGREAERDAQLLAGGRYAQRTAAAPSRLNTLMAYGPRRALGPSGGLLARRLAGRAAGLTLLPADIAIEVVSRGAGIPVRQAPVLGRAAQLRSLEAQLAGRSPIGYGVTTALDLPAGLSLAQDELGAVGGATAPLGAWTGIGTALGGVLGGVDWLFGQATRPFMGAHRSQITGILESDPRARGLTQEQQRQLWQAVLEQARDDQGGLIVREPSSRIVSRILDQGFHAGGRPLADTWQEPRLRFLGADVSGPAPAGRNQRFLWQTARTLSRLYMQLSGSEQVSFRPQDYVVSAHDPDFYAYQEQGGPLARAAWHRQNEARLYEQQLATARERQRLENEFHRRERAQGAIPGAIQGIGDWIGGQARRMELAERWDYYTRIKPPIERIPGHQFIPWELRESISRKFGWHTRGDFGSPEWEALDRYDLRLFNTAPPLSGFFAPFWGAQQAAEALGSRRHTQAELRMAWATRRAPFPNDPTGNLAIMRRQQRVPAGVGGWLARNVPGVAGVALRKTQYEYLDPDTRLPGSVNDPDSMRYDPEFRKRVKRLQQGDMNWLDPQDWITGAWRQFHEKTFAVGNVLDVTVGAARRAFMGGVGELIAGGPQGRSITPPLPDRRQVVNALFGRKVDADTYDFWVPFSSGLYSDFQRQQLQEHYSNRLRIIEGQRYVLESGRVVHPQDARKIFNTQELGTPVGDMLSRQLDPLTPEMYTPIQVYTTGQRMPGRADRLPDAVQRLLIQGLEFDVPGSPEYGDPFPGKRDLVRESHRVYKAYTDQMTSIHGGMALWDQWSPLADEALERTVFGEGPRYPTPAESRAARERQAQLRLRRDQADVLDLVSSLDVPEPFAADPLPEPGMPWGGGTDYGLSAGEKQTLGRMQAAQIQASLRGIDTVVRGRQQSPYMGQPMPSEDDILTGDTDRYIPRSFGPSGNVVRARAAAARREAINRSLRSFGTSVDMHRAATRFVRGARTGLRRLGWRTQDRRDALTQAGISLDAEQGRYQGRLDDRQLADVMRMDRQKGYQLGAINRRAQYRTDAEYRRWAVEERYMEEDQARQSRYLGEDQSRQSRYLDQDQTRRLVRLQEDQQFQLEELAEEHQERMADIARRGRQRREDIEKSYNRRARDLTRAADRQIGDLDDDDSVGRATIRQRLAYRLSDLDVARQDQIEDSHLAEGRQRDQAQLTYADAESDLRERQERTMARTLEDQLTERERLQERHRTESARQEDAHTTERERKTEQHEIRLSEIQQTATEARTEVEQNTLEGLDEMRHAHREQDEDLEFQFNERRLKLNDESKKLELEAEKEASRLILEELELFMRAKQDILEGNLESDAVKAVRSGTGTGQAIQQYAPHLSRWFNEQGELVVPQDVYSGAQEITINQNTIIHGSLIDTAGMRQAQRKAETERARLGEPLTTGQVAAG